MLSIISIDEIEKWNEIVKSFKDYDVYYLAEYTKAFQFHGDGEPILFYYDDEETRGINVSMKRDIGKDKRFGNHIEENQYFDLITPYGYGGFLIEGNKGKEAVDRLTGEYEKYCKRSGIISEFIRFHPILKNNIGLDDFYEISGIGSTVSMDLQSKDYIWENISSKNRNMIRKAIKSGVEIYWGRSPNLIEEFIGMYNATMDKDMADDYYYFGKDFYKSVLDDLENNCLIFYGLHQGKIIAMSMILFANGKMHYHLSASEKEYMRHAPTNLLLYKAACWGADNRYKTFHLGGGLGSKEDSLYKFKKAFNRNKDNDFYIGRKIFDRKAYDRLVKIRKEDKGFDGGSSFFPLYRG